MRLFLNMDDVNSAALPQQPDQPEQISGKKKSSKSNSNGKRRRPKKESELPRKKFKGEVSLVEGKHDDNSREADKQKEDEELYLMLSQTFSKNLNNKSFEAKKKKKKAKEVKKVINAGDVEMAEITEPSNKHPCPTLGGSTEGSGDCLCKDGDDGINGSGKDKTDGDDGGNGKDKTDGDNEDLIASYGSANVSLTEDRTSTKKDEEGNGDVDSKGGDDDDSDDDGGWAYTIPPPPDPGEIPDLLSAFERDLLSNYPMDVDIFKLFKSWKKDAEKFDLAENDNEENNNDNQHDIDGNEGDSLDVVNNNGDSLDVVVNKNGGLLPLEVRNANKFIKIHDDDNDENNEVQLLDDDPKHGRVSPIKNGIDIPTFSHHHTDELKVLTGVRNNQNKTNHLSLKNVSGFLDSSILEIKESDFKAWSQSYNGDNLKTECSTPVQVGCDPSTSVSGEGLKDGKNDMGDLSHRILGVAEVVDVKLQSNESIVIADDLFDSKHGKEVEDNTNGHDSDVIPSSPNPNHSINFNGKTSDTNKNFDRDARAKDPDIVFPSPKISKSSRSIRRIQSMRVNFSRHFSSSTSIPGFNSQFETNHQTLDWNDAGDFKVDGPKNKEEIVIDDDDDDDDNYATKNEENFQGDLNNARTPVQKQLNTVSHLQSSTSLSYKPDFHTFLEEFEKDFFSSDKDDTGEGGSGDPVVDPPSKPQFPRMSRDALNQLKKELADTSQLTYTQALECLDYSNIFTENDHSEAQTPAKFPSDSKNESSFKSHTGITDSCGKKSTNVKPSAVEEILPGFDLNFDLDEWSDDQDVVLPSPPKTTRSDSNLAGNFPLTNNNACQVQSSSPFKAPLSVAKTAFTTPVKSKFFAAGRSPSSKSPGLERSVRLRERIMRNMKLHDEPPLGQFTALKVPSDGQPRSTTSADGSLSRSGEKANDGDLDFDDDFVDDQVLGDFPIDEFVAKIGNEGSKSDRNNKSPNERKGLDQCQTSTPNVNFKKSMSLYCNR